MYLTASNLPHYLISRGLITTQSVVSGDFVLIETGRRNRNFKVLRGSGPGLFVKQIKSSEPQAIATIEREGLFYTRLRSDPASSHLRAITPEFVDYDARRHALIVHLLDGYESIAEFHRRIGGVSIQAAALLGDCLARYHASAQSIRPDLVDRKLFPCDVPWVMNLRDAGYAVLHHYGPVGTQLATALQQFPGFPERLSTLRALWQIDSLTHGDMKWDNCMLPVGTGAETDGPKDLRIIDWELLDLGDGAWDVSTILKEFVMAWLLANSNLPAFALPGSVPLEAMQSAVRSFWNAYVARRGFDGAARAVYLDRSIRFCSARMTVAVLEYLYSAPQMTTLMMAMLQLASSILEAPETARTNLFGLGVAA
ncbi:MAG: phosphotransferase [Bryobacteraceae bacterium]|jgi:Phosphotransferase enzyme family